MGLSKKVRISNAKSFESLTPSTLEVFPFSTSFNNKTFPNLASLIVSPTLYSDDSNFSVCLYDGFLESTSITTLPLCDLIF